MAEEKKEQQAAQKVNVGDNGNKAKRITAEELRAKAHHMQDISDDQQVLGKLEEAAQKVSEIDTAELLKGIQEITGGNFADVRDDGPDEDKSDRKE